MPASDAEKVVKEFFAYAVDRRKDGVSDFATIVEGFKRVMLAADDKDGTFPRKMLRMMREFLAADPRYQKRLLAPMIDQGRRLSGSSRRRRLPADEGKQNGDQDARHRHGEYQLVGGENPDAAKRGVQKESHEVLEEARAHEI